MIILYPDQSAAPVPLSQWVPLVLPAVSECPDVALRQSVLRAAMDFCEVTRCWKGIADPIDVVAGTAEYTIPTPSGASTVIVERLDCDGRKLAPKTPDQLQEQYENWRTLEPGVPSFYTQLGPNAVRLIRTPATGVPQGLVFRCAYRPARDATTLPSFLWDQFADPIAYKAIVFLCETPGQPWTNPQAAQYYDQKYIEDRGRAVWDVSKAYSRAVNRVRLQTF